MKLTKDEIADIKAYAEQAPFRLFLKALNEYYANVCERLPECPVDNLRFEQGKLGGIRACRNILNGIVTGIYDEPNK